jgi:hypothetical protein
MKSVGSLLVAASAILLASPVAGKDEHQLGSERNPVKVRMPDGERAYLDRLRCPDGSPPAYERQGSGGPARDGDIVDYYAVTCPGAEPVTVIMDMYHSNREDDPVPGFTIVPREDYRQ